MNPVFETLALAQAYYDDEPKATAIIFNSPRPGMATVTLEKDKSEEFGDYRDLMVSLLRQEKRRELADREEYEAELTRAAQCKVGAELAAERGQTGASVDMFAKGLAGEHAKIANPRALGLEPVFRAGRKAKDDSEVQRRVRVAAHGMRADYPFSKFADLKYQCRPIPYHLEEQ